MSFRPSKPIFPLKYLPQSVRSIFSLTSQRASIFRRTTLGIVGVAMAFAAKHIMVNQDSQISKNQTKTQFNHNFSTNQTSTNKTNINTQTANIPNSKAKTPIEQGSTGKSVPTIFKSRKDHLQQVIDRPAYDVVIIGGGCNGVGVILDAASRGLRVLLIEQGDFAQGASSKSTKILHGGVRYLQQALGISTASLSSRRQKLHLVQQALHQRSNVIANAPHLAQSMPFVIPCTSLFNSAYYYIGIVMYYFLSRVNGPTSVRFNFPYFLRRDELKGIFPNLSERYRIGVVYEDGVFNDSRYLMTTLLTATSGNDSSSMPKSFVPANCLNRASFKQFVKDAQGRICGIIFKDQTTGKDYTVACKYAVNCTGTWADQIRQKDDPQVKKRIKIVAGSHITYTGQLSSKRFALCTSSSDGRVLLVVPWLGRIISGTTERNEQEPAMNPICSEDERKFINEETQHLFDRLSPKQFFQHERARWCGYRPLVLSNESDNADSKEISRIHVIEESKSGLLSLMGGKWTIFRKMGADLIDVVAKDMAKRHNKVIPTSPTVSLPLLGSAPNSEVLEEAIFSSFGQIGSHLFHHYGSLSPLLTQGDMTPICGPITRAEVEWLVRNQMATPEDILTRRTHLSFLVGKNLLVETVGEVVNIYAKVHQLSLEETSQLNSQTMESVLKCEFD